MPQGQNGGGLVCPRASGRAGCLHPHGCRHCHIPARAGRGPHHGRAPGAMPRRRADPGHSREPNADLSQTSPVFSAAGTTERGASVSVITRSGPRTDATSLAAGTVSLTPAPAKRSSGPLGCAWRHRPLVGPGLDLNAGGTGRATPPGELAVRVRQAPRGKSRAARHGAATQVCRIRSRQGAAGHGHGRAPFGGCCRGENRERTAEVCVGLAGVAGACPRVRRHRRRSSVVRAAPRETAVASPGPLELEITATGARRWVLAGWGRRAGDGAAS